MNINGLDKQLLGIRKSDGKKIFITKPSWDCGWYWGFGYIGNAQEHFHLSYYLNRINMHMRDALLLDYDLDENIEKNLWLFFELVKTAYALKDCAEVLGRGGSHVSTNPLSSVIMNKDEADRINKVVLPAIFNKLADLYEGNV